MLISIPTFFLKGRKNKKPHLIIFLILVIISFLETIGVYYSNIGKPNVIFYNIFWVYIETVLILLFFIFANYDKKANKLIYLAIVSFLIFGTVKSFFFTSLYSFHSDSYLIGSFLIILTCLNYFFGIIKRNWFWENELIYVPSFWITTLILFFYSCSFIYFASFHLITIDNMEKMLTINHLINIISGMMYLTFGVAFYFPLLQKKSGDSSPDFS